MVLILCPFSGALFGHRFDAAHSEPARPRTQKGRPKTGAKMGPRRGPKTRVRGPLQSRPTAVFAMCGLRTSPGQSGHSHIDSVVDIPGLSFCPEFKSN